MVNDLKVLLKELERQGWEICESSRGIMAVPPNKEKPMVSIHKTARGSRSWQNMIAQLRRSGFEHKGR